jgi:hypothetical protein
MGQPDDEDGLVPDGVEDGQVVAPHGAVDVVALEVPGRAPCDEEVVAPPRPAPLRTALCCGRRQ